MDAIAQIIYWFLTGLSIAIVGRALLSWVDPGMNSAVGKLLYRITEPLLAPVRRIVPSMGMFDFTPIIVLVAILLLQRFIAQSF